MDHPHARLSWNEAVRLGDEWRKRHGATRRRREEYDPMYGFTNRWVQCGRCGLSGRLHVEFELRRPDLYGMDDPGDDAGEEEVEDYEASQPEWQTDITWGEDDPPDARALRRVANEVRNERRRLYAASERLTEWERRITASIEEAERHGRLANPLDHENLESVARMRARQSWLPQLLRRGNSGAVGDLRRLSVRRIRAAARRWIGRFYR